MKNTHNSPSFLGPVKLIPIAVAAVVVLTSARSHPALSAPGLGAVSAPASERPPMERATTGRKSARLERGVKIPFEFVEGLMVCTMPTDRGSLRLIVDTGANATALLGKPRPIEIIIGSKSLRLVPAPLQTSVLDQVNNMLPPGKRIAGILGEDALVQFRRVTEDYKNLVIEFDP